MSNQNAHHCLYNKTAAGLWIYSLMDFCSIMVKYTSVFHCCFFHCARMQAEAHQKKSSSLPRDINIKKLWCQSTRHDSPIPMGKLYHCRDNFNVNDGYCYIMLGCDLARHKQVNSNSSKSLQPFIFCPSLCQCLVNIILI